MQRGQCEVFHNKVKNAVKLNVLNKVCPNKGILKSHKCRHSLRVQKNDWPTSVACLLLDSILIITDLYFRRIIIIIILGPISSLVP
jgi:hypothetical protein